MEETRRLLGETLTHGGGDRCVRVYWRNYICRDVLMQRGCILILTNFIILLLLFEEYQSFGIKKNVEEMGI